MTESALTTSWLAARLGMQSGRIDAMRRAGQLYAVRRPGEQDYLYPSWQFDEDGRPLPFVERLMRTAREAGLDEQELEAVLNRRAGLVGGRRLVDLIRSGAEAHVLDTVQRGLVKRVTLGMETGALAGQAAAITKLFTATSAERKTTIRLELSGSEAIHAT